MTRWTIRILICLLLGAILNVAVAWGATYQPVTSMKPRNEPTAQDVAEWRATAGKWSKWPPLYLEHWKAFGIDCIFTVAADPPRVEYEFDETGTSMRGFGLGYSGNEGFSPVDSRLRVLAGWPARSFVGDRIWKVEGGTSLFEMRDFQRIPRHIEYNQQLSFGFDHPIRQGVVAHIMLLPLHPLPSGFIINTLFYALICFALWFTPGIIRRRIRSARGRCIKCGYDLRGSPDGECPECGWGRQ